MSVKIPLFEYQERDRIMVHLEHSQYQDLVMLREWYKDTYEKSRYYKELTIKEMAEKVIITFLKESKELDRWKKKNPDRVEKIENDEFVNDGKEDDEQDESDAPEPEEEVAEETEELDLEPEVAEVLEKDAPEPAAENTEERKESHENWLRRMNIVGNNG